MSGDQCSAEKLKPFQDEANRCFIWILVWMAVALSALIISLIPALIPGEQTLPGWFQRSGSITTIGALFISIYVNRMRDRLEGKFTADLAGIEVFRRIELPFKIAAFSAVALSIVGTIVWGYGDVLIAKALDSMCQAR